MIEIRIFKNYSKVKNQEFSLQQIKFPKSKPSQLSRRSIKFSKKKKRGHYRSYNLQLKVTAVEKIKKGDDIRAVSEELGIPVKNLRRWFQEGPYRKKGCGRKSLDLEMEQKLYRWCLEEMERTQRRVSRETIRQQALKFIRQNAPFKASKGWTDKFVRKYNLIRNKKRHATTEGERDLEED